MKYFLLWESFLYVGFMVGDLFLVPWSALTNIMKYVAVVSCVVYVWFRNEKIGQPLAFALLYSVCADYFMLFTDKIVLGILGFICVQACYSNSKYFLLWGIVFEVAIWYMLITGENGNANSVIFSAFCYIIFSIRNLIKVEKNILFIGMLLLFIGDIFVGLNQVLPIVAPAMWFFYLPSQVCVVRANCN